jgi:energy-coupling factor transporter transmembrane protein EcfT
MAELTGFHYCSGSSVLHRLDVRVKLALLAAFSAACLHLSAAGLLLFGLSLLAAIGMTRLVPAVNAKELRWLGLLLAVVFVARALSTEGTAVLAMGTIVISREGLVDGMLVCLRLILVFLVGSVFVASTRTGDIKAGVQWFLKPLPFVAAERAATMLSLIVRFIPLIFEEVSRTTDAQRARVVENRHNPVYRMVKFGIPLLRRIFETCDRLVLAMEARCYTEARTGRELSVGRRDWMVLAACSLVLALLLAL